MDVGFLIIGVISSFMWTKKCTGAIPTMTLTASSSPYFDIGGSISLTCAINEDVGIKNVYLSRNEREDYVWIQIKGPTSCETFPLTSSDPHVYSVTCEQQMKLHIEMNGAVAADHNSTWSCQMSAVSGICSTPCISTTSVRTAQRVPVSSVQLTDGTGQPLVTPVPVLDGSNTDFRCDTYPNGSRPSALFNWYKRSENQSPILIQDHSISTPGPKPEVDLSISISYSTLTLMGNRSYQNMYIYCEARDETNRGNFSRSREAQLNIVYGPGSSSSLTPDMSVYEVEESQKAVDIICRASCNPSCTYRWLKGNVQINNSNTLSLGIVQKNMTGNYICEAFNIIHGQRRGSNISMEVIIKDAPVVKLQAAVQDVNPYRVKQGHENVVLVCEVVDAYPQPTLFVWTHNANEVQNGSRSTLTIPVAARQTDGTWGCKGLNGYGRPIESQLQVDVQFSDGPVIEPITNKTVSESQMFSVTCNVDSNPLPVSVTWTKDNNTTFSHNTAVLTVNSISRYDSGTYRCRAVNTIHPSGQNEESLNGTEGFYLNVQYGAEIINLSVPERNTVNENTTATLRCLVDSNPASNITWTRQGIMGTLQSDYFVHESQLIIEHAECLDTSNYTCNAINGLGQSVERNVPLYITCHPRTDFRSPPVTTVYSKRYGNASLNYTVISFPEPTFKWSFIGNGSEDRWIPSSATNHDNGLQTVIMFQNLSIDDFGFYKVIAKNIFPTSAIEVFQLIMANVPDIPSNVTVTDVKQTSLTVRWVAGYNGGLEQTFHIMITTGDIARRVYAPDPGYGKSGTQTIEDLIPNTEYSISMSANNSMGSSSETNVIIQITLKVPDAISSPIAAIAGGVTGAIVAILLVAIGIILWRRYQHNKKSMDGDGLNKDFKQRSNQIGNIYANTTYRSDLNNTEYESLQASKIEASPYQALTDCGKDSSESDTIRLSGADKIYLNTAQTGVNCDTEYESLQSNKKETNVYQVLNGERYK